MEAMNFSERSMGLNHTATFCSREVNFMWLAVLAFCLPYRKETIPGEQRELQQNGKVSL
jgi:hypothetical protein